MRVRLRALRDLHAGDEVTLSFVAPTLPLAERREALRALLGARAAQTGRCGRRTCACATWQCACERCAFEARVHGALDTPALRRLAFCALEDGRFDDAERIFDAWIRAAPHDGDAHHALGAARLSAGRWAGARAAWARGMALASAHPLLGALAAKERAYDVRGVADGGAADGGTAACGAGAPCEVGSSAAAGAGARAELADAPPPAPSAAAWRELSGRADGGRVFATVEPLFSRAECRALCAAAEAAAARAGGWSTGRHYSVPTTDLPVHALADVAAAWRVVCARRLFPLLRAQFELGSDEELCTHDAFVVKYEAGRQALLPLHTDEAQLSVTLPLNERTEYDGGGTFFAHLGRAVGADAGHVVSFDSHLLHGGDPITRGVRYIVAAFLYTAPRRH